MSVNFVLDENSTDDTLLCFHKLQAFRAIKCFLGKLEKVSENPDLALEAGILVLK